VDEVAAPAPVGVGVTGSECSSMAGGVSFTRLIGGEVVEKVVVEEEEEEEEDGTGEDKEDEDDEVEVGVGVGSDMETRRRKRKT